MHNLKLMNKKLKTFIFSTTIIFAIIGFLFTSVFIAMQFDLLNVKGTISERNKFFEKSNDINNNIIANKKDGKLISTQTSSSTKEDNSCTDEHAKICSWNETREWQVVSGGLIKDKDVIIRVAKETDVSPRLLAAIVVPEQTRFFTAEREVFKRYFEPLKILGSLTKFSLGISGIKQETALLIERYASDESTPFYPGSKYAKLIAYESADNHDDKLYARLTNAKDHYYSYLYTAVFIKEIESQWKYEGYDIRNNAGAITTLFNLGFEKSHPNPIPKLGGAQITTGGQNYTYGDLGDLFYNSSELIDVFPR